MMLRIPGPMATLAALGAAIGLTLGCGATHRGSEPPPHAESWSVTAWGELYEVFPEVDALAAGAAAAAHTHVTVLEGFAPLQDGAVEIVLRDERGEQTFRADAPTRPGIFTVTLVPESAGGYDLAFRIRSAAGSEEIRGGRVRVGPAGAPGGSVRAPTPRGATGGGEPVPFLKEQQWRADFATAWVRSGSLPPVTRGLARVRPPAGGEATVTAPVDGVLQARPWPYLGAPVRAGDALFRLVPRVAAERSLPGLGAEVASLEVELAAARARLGRLEELLEVEAASRREVEEARVRLATLEGRFDAARRDLAAARAAREGQGTADAHTLRAPFAGEVAAVSASPGAAVAAGDALARVVRTDRAWLEVELPPEGARLLAASGPAGVVVETGEGPALAIRQDSVRLVSVAPEVDPARGTVTALLELRAPGLRLGTTVEAELLLAGEREGVVVPTSALVDDGGVTVVYLQLSGERFVRQEVEVEARQGERALVEGLAPGQRLVTRGGDAVRRATLMSSGQAEGHVH
jgi:RND family efflux transporter MFP subunit